MHQDLLLEPAQLGGRLDPEFLADPVPEPLERSQRLGLAPGAVQRVHQLEHRPLAQRFVLHQLFQLTDQLAGEPALQVRLDSSLERLDSQLLEPGDLCSLQSRRTRSPGARHRARASMLHAGSRMPRQDRSTTLLAPRRGPTRIGGRQPTRRRRGSDSRDPGSSARCSRLDPSAAAPVPNAVARCAPTGPFPCLRRRRPIARRGCDRSARRDRRA